jgi:hypothetical protein
MINIVAVGAGGMDGLPGKDGQSGNPGQAGLDAEEHFWDDDSPTRGSDGGPGGAGSDGASGSGGGPGGSVVISVQEYRGGIEVDCRGGRGVGGKGGDGGDGGDGGPGGKGGSFRLWFNTWKLNASPPIWHVDGGGGGSGGIGGLGGKPGPNGLTGKGKITSYGHSEYEPGSAPGKRKSWG